MTTAWNPSHAAHRPPISDRWGFKPVASVLLVATVFASAGLTAFLISPPFLAAGAGVAELQRRLDAAGADFEGIPRLPQRSTIYAADGRTVLAREYLDNREIVALDEVSPWAVKAVLAIEDAGFYEHGALDIQSMLRAAAANVRAGEVVQGGSTITQQLVKNTLGLDPTDQSIERKFQEFALAQRVEQTYTKDQILELYLNEVYLGNNVYGIGTASWFYFGKPASELSLTEGALLAGLIRAPAYYDPLERPHKAWLRRNDVLLRMIAVGPHDGGVSEKRGRQAMATDIDLADDVGQTGIATPPFLVNYVKEQILEDPNGWYSVLGATPEERLRSIKEGGLSIVTTLKPRWQRAAQATAREPWARTPLHPDYRPAPDLAIVTLENETGAIRTMLSGRNYAKDEINTVTTAHQPGSSFKPYILASAFEQGIPPSATYSGAQGPIPECRNADGSVWSVTNAEGSSRGYLNLWDATADSVNAVFARLIVDVGPDEVVEMAHRVGVTSPLGAYCALATGSVGITPLDQASGYQTFANAGVHCAPYAVQEIMQGTTLLYQHVPQCTRVVSAPVANLVTELLRGPVEHGTASSVFSSGWGPWPLAGKTGTADSNKEVWFAGYTRQLTTAVWVGSPRTPYELPNYWGYSVFGGSICAPIFKSYMLRAMDDFPARKFAEARLVQVPNVVGMSEEEARIALREARLRARTQIVGSYLPEGTVVAQEPRAGSETLPNVAVLLSISNGVAPQVSLPNVEGLKLESAQSILGGLHLFTTVVERTTNDKKLDGVVIAMRPRAGNVVLEGSTVTLYVAVYEKEPKPTPTPTPSPSPSPLVNLLRIRRG
jgi:membrane peptidoglycan carboxypeptidase